MEVNRYVLEQDGLHRLEAVSQEEMGVEYLDDEKVYWLEVIAEDRSAVTPLLDALRVPAQMQYCIAEEGRQTHFRFNGHSVFADLPYRTDSVTEGDNYLGVLIHGNILITLSRQYSLHRDVIDNFEAVVVQDKPQRFQLVYNLINEFIADQVQVINVIRQKVVKLARDMEQQLEDVDSSAIHRLKQVVADLSVTVNKQYSTLSFLPRTSWSHSSNNERKILADLSKKLEFADKALGDIHQRLESIHLHYLMQLQEKSNRRINILTIVQAIFVPLTLIVGVFGMNFKRMPELGFHNAYYLCLGGMVLLATVELVYFYKKGWFD